MREKQLLIDFLCTSAGGPMYYRGRDMTLVHKGMRISEGDWNVFLGHAAATLAKFQVPEAEQRDVVAFVQSSKKNALNVDVGISRLATRRLSDLPIHGVWSPFMRMSVSSSREILKRGFNFPAHRNLRVSEGVENLLR